MQRARGRIKLYPVINSRFHAIIFNRFRFVYCCRMADICQGIFLFKFGFVFPESPVNGRGNIGLAGF